MRVFAAASLGTVLKEASAAWGGPPLSISAAGSGTIARQVAAGAPADVVILANTEWMAWLADQNALRSAPTNVATNRLVVVGQSGTRDDFETGDGRIAIGDPLSVPAGRYAQEVLTSLNLWPELEPRLIRTDNVRAALTFALRGAAPYAIVYASDVTDPGMIIWTLPADSHSPITYPAAVVSDHAEATAFIEWLAGPNGQALLQTHGFSAEVPQ